MESQVQELLNEERKVNSQVKQALQTKREKLATITQHTERAVANERRELQEELNQKIAQVSRKGGRPAFADAQTDNLTLSRRIFSFSYLVNW